MLMHSRLLSRDVVLTLGGNINHIYALTEEEDTWQHEWQPLCVSLSLLALFLSQAFSLVSFPISNSFSLSLSRFTEV